MPVKVTFENEVKIHNALNINGAAAFFKKCAFLAFPKVNFSFSESGSSPCLRTLVFRKVEVHLAFVVF